MIKTIYVFIITLLGSYSIYTCEDNFNINQHQNLITTQVSPGRIGNSQNTMMVNYTLTSPLKLDDSSYLILDFTDSGFNYEQFYLGHITYKVVSLSYFISTLHITYFS